MFLGLHDDNSLAITTTLGTEDLPPPPDLHPSKNVLDYTGETLGLRRKGRDTHLMKLSFTCLDPFFGSKYAIGILAK